MNLERARRLKQDLVAESAGRAGLRRRALWRAAAPGRLAPPVALGIEGRDGSYRLAIRVQRGIPGVERVVEDLLRAAGGEAGVRQVGYLIPQVRGAQEVQAAQGAPEAHPARHETNGACRLGEPAHPFGPHPHRPGPPRPGGVVGGPRHRHRPLVSGLSVGGEEGPGGTLGLLVEEAPRRPGPSARPGRPAGPGRRGLLASAHALRGIEVVQPAGEDGGASPADRVARLVRGFLPGPRARNRVDAAFAELVGEVAGPGGADARALPGLGRLAGLRREPVHSGLGVAKVGRGSGVTRGRVGAFELDDLAVTYGPGIGDAVFDGQMEIEPLPGEAPFSRRGDSGAVVVDDALRGVGLLFAGNGLDASYAHPLAHVLDQLRVRLV